MIFGHIKQLSDAEKLYPSVIAKALRYLEKTDFTTLEPGRYDIDGDKMFALVQKVVTKPKNDGKPETHRKYIDVQYLVRGNEWIGATIDCGQFPIVEDLLAEKDLAFYGNVSGETNLEFTPGSFGVFFPTDIHRPLSGNGKEEEILKVVIKIAVELI